MYSFANILYKELLWKKGRWSYVLFGILYTFFSAKPFTKDIIEFLQSNCRALIPLIRVLRAVYVQHLMLDFTEVVYFLFCAPQTAVLINEMTSTEKFHKHFPHQNTKYYPTQALALTGIFGHCSTSVWTPLSCQWSMNSWSFGNCRGFYSNGCVRAMYNYITVFHSLLPLR